MAEFFLLFSDDEEEEVPVRIVRRNLRDSSNPLTLPNESFIQRFRLTKPAFEYVLNTIALKAGKRKTSIPPILKLCLTLEIIAGGNYQSQVGSDSMSPVAQSTLSHILHECVDAMENTLCAQWIKWPSDNEENETKRFFLEKFRIPGVIGCVDGSHVGLLHPHVQEKMFLNRKGHHSINSMFISDHKCRIIAVCAKYGGAAKDSFIWNNSAERLKLELDYQQETKSSLLLGDSGYPSEPWLLVPFRKAQERETIYFNTIHAKAQNTIKQCIRMLKARWRILLANRKCRYDPRTVTQIINVSAALHNICIHFKAPLVEVIDEDDSDYHWMADENSSNCSAIGDSIRNRIKTSLMSQIE